jgi:hypothetical protein
MKKNKEEQSWKRRKLNKDILLCYYKLIKLWNLRRSKIIPE